MSEELTTPTGPQQPETDLMSPQDKSLERLTRRVLWIGIAAGLLTVIFYLLIYFSLGVWQILAAAAAVLVGLFILISGHLSVRSGDLDRAGLLALTAGVVTFGIGELFWSGATLFNLLNGLFLILIIGLTLIPKEAQNWISIAAIYIIAFLAINFGSPFPRFNFEESPLLFGYLRSITIILSILAAWILIRTIRGGNIRSRLVTAFLVVTLIPLGILAISTNLNTQTILANNANQLLFAVASDAAATFDTYITNNRSIIQTEAQIPALVELLSLDADSLSDRNNPIRRAANTTLSALGRKDSTRIQSYAILDANGINILDTVFLDIGNDESGTEYFQKSFSDNVTFASSVEFSEELGLFHAIYFSSPVKDPIGNTLGVLRVKTSAAVLQEIIRETNDLAGEDSFGVLFEEIEENYLHLGHGIAPETLFTSIMPYEPDQLQELQIQRRVPLSTLFGEISMTIPDLHENLSAVDEQTFFSATDFATGERVNQVAVLRLEEKPEWLVAYFQPQDIFLAVAEQQAVNSIVLVLVISFAVVFAAIFFAGVLAKPITQLTQTAQLVAGGNLKARAEVSSKDEVGILARTFNSMTDQLNDVITNLEDTVTERTAALERRADFLSASTEVGRAATSIYNLDDLLPKVTQLISEHFGFYQAGIFLIDEVGEYAVMRAANSEGGLQMLARGHRLKVGEQGIVGFVTGTGKARIALDVGEDAAHFDTPELPETRSEMGLPLLSGGRLLGALDVQSKQANAFSQEDVEALRVLADQVAMAINNAELFGQLQQSLIAERKAYGEISRETWKNMVGKRSGWGFRFGGKSIVPTRGAWNPEMLDASITKKTVVGKLDNNSTLSIPIMISNQVVGVLQVRKDNPDDIWSSEDQDLLEALVVQLGLTLDSARLYQETQQLASQEQLASEITTNIRQSLDIDMVLQTAVREFGEVLGAREVVIRLNNPEPDDRAPNN